MAALPPPLESSRRRGRAAGIGATVLGVLVAIAVALLFILVIGADKGQWASAGAAYHARLNPARYRRRPPPRAPPGCQINQPSEVVIVILDIILMALVSATIESLLTWSICTQYRDGGCEHPRIRRRLQVQVRVVSLGEPEAHSMALPDVRTSV